MTAARARLGDEGVRDAYRAASRGEAVKVPGAALERQENLTQLARGVTLAREGAERHCSQGWRVEERQRERAAERDGSATARAAAGAGQGA